MSLNPRYVLGDLDLTDAPFAIIRAASDYGSPEWAAQIIDSLLPDGEIEESPRASNRTMTFSVFIEESDLLALAQAEEALMVECGKDRNTFSIDPGDGYAPTTIFDTFRVKPSFVYDSDMEWEGYRRYDLSWRALPFGRSVAEVIDPALTIGGTVTTVTIADGTSATGWTSPDGTVTSTGTALRVPSGATTNVAVNGDTTVRQYRPEATFTAAAVDYSATSYITLDVYTDHAWETVPFAPELYIDGALAQNISSTWISGGVRATYVSSDTSATTLRVRPLVETTASSVAAAPDASVLVANVKRSNQPPNASSTGRESLRTVTVTGSARTQASLAISHATQGLGDVLAYTCPALSAGYTPDLRRWRVSNSNTVTADSSLVSGSRNMLTVPDTFLVPAAPLPRGGYVLVARMSSASTGDVTVRPTWTAATKVGTARFGQQSGTAASVTLKTTAYQWVVLGGMTLPPTDVADASAASVEITIGGGGQQVYLDEACLFYYGDDAALTWVPCGSGTPAVGSVHNRLWIDTASTTRTEPAVWLGTLADRSDAFHAGDNLPSWGVHSFPPGDMRIYVASGATNPDVSLRHFPRWFTHAAA